MSDVSQGPGWWQASDGKWYSPSQVSADTASPDPQPTASVPTAGTAYQGPPPVDLGGSYAPPSVPPAPAPGFGPTPTPAAGYGPPPAAGAYGAPAPAPGYGQPPAAGAYGYQPAGYGYPNQGPKNNGMAIAAMVCSFGFFIFGIPSVVAIILGFIAKGQIAKSNGMQTGRGMALVGIILGFIGIGLTILYFIAVAHAVNNDCAQFNNC